MAFYEEVRRDHAMIAPLPVGRRSAYRQAAWYSAGRPPSVLLLYHGQPKTGLVQFAGSGFCTSGNVDAAEETG